MTSRRDALRIDDQSRRQFIQHAARAAFGVTALPWLQQLAATEPTAEPAPQPFANDFVIPRADRIIHLCMAGGMCHFDSFDPKPALTAQGASQSLATSVDGMQFSSNLPRLAQLGHELTVIRSMSTTQGAHQQGQYFLRTGYTQRNTIRHPTMGAWIDHLRGKSNPMLPGSVIVGGGSDHPGRGFLPSIHTPLILGAADDGLPHSSPAAHIDDSRQQRRLGLLRAIEQATYDSHAHASKQAYQTLFHEAMTLMDSQDLKAFHIREEDPAVLAAYGENRFGLGCALARRLVEHDVRHVEVTMGGWDTHIDHNERAAQRFVELDQAMSTLLIDLRRRGLLDSTIVLLTTEFGRTPDLNTNNGRDHHPQVFSSVLAGGPFTGGRVYGASDDHAKTVADLPVGVPDLHASVGYALGLPIDRVVHSPSQRPFTVGDRGRVISDWFRS